MKGYLPLKYTDTFVNYNFSNFVSLLHRILLFKKMHTYLTSQIIAMFGRYIVDNDNSFIDID